jgi:hypothetical protein
MGQGIEESGMLILTLRMEEGHKFGETDLDMRESGETIWRMVKEDLFMPMEIFMKERGQMTKPMDMGNIFMWMEPCTMGLGRKTSKRVMVKKHGLMELFIKVNT